jgi:hypothetical protein
MRTNRPLLRLVCGLSLVLGTCLLQVLPFQSTLSGVIGAVPAFADGNCVYQDNLGTGETATYFISRCRKAGIRSEFPGQWLDSPLGDIESAANAGDSSAQSARKLLTDGRFAKFSLPYLNGNQGISHSSGNSTASYTVTIAADPGTDQTVRLEYGDGGYDYGFVGAGEGDVYLQFSHAFDFPSEDYTFTQAAYVLEGGGEDYAYTYCIP